MGEWKVWSILKVIYNRLGFVCWAPCFFPHWHTENSFPWIVSYFVEVNPWYTYGTSKHKAQCNVWRRQNKSNYWDPETQGRGKSTSYTCMISNKSSIMCNKPCYCLSFGCRTIMWNISWKRMRWWERLFLIIFLFCSVLFVCLLFVLFSSC